VRILSSVSDHYASTEAERAGGKLEEQK